MTRDLRISTLRVMTQVASTELHGEVHYSMLQCLQGGLGG